MDDPSPTPTISTPKISVHRCLGGGEVADLLLWKRPNAAISVILSVWTFWFLFEKASYSFLTLVANVILLLVVILFFWAKSATLLNRPLPPLPSLEVSEEAVERVADAARVWINCVLAVAYEIAIERNVKLFLEVVFALWLASFVGGLLSFMSLVYIGVVLAFTIPVLYDKYQDEVDEKLCEAKKALLPWYQKIDAAVLSKIPVSRSKQKKIQ